MIRRTDHRGTALATLGLLLFAGCMPLHPVRKPEPLRNPRATLADMTAPRRAADEETRLPHTAAGQLRRAWLLTRRGGNPQQAVRVANRILYDRARHAASVRALAYYVRAQAFARIGQKDRTREDLQKALTMSVDRGLRQRCGKELVALVPPRKAPERPAVVARTGKPQILPRSAWNASGPRPGRLDPMRGIRKLTIHHSANLSRSTRRQVVATQIRGIQQYHLSQNRWGDIGYHYLIDPAGRIWQGRSLRYQGAHAGGVNNHNNVGICLLGKFTGGGQNPTREQVTAMTELVVWLRGEYRIPPLGVLTHKEIKSQTVCPGSRLQSVVDRMRKLLAARGDTGGTGSVAGR